MVEQDTRAAIHIVSFTIFFHNPEAIQLSHCIRAVRMERRVFILRHFFHLSIQFRSRCLVDAASLCQSAQTYGFQYTEYPCSIHVGRKFRRVEAHLHVALCGQVVDFRGAHLAHYLQHTHGVRQVRIVQVEVRFSFQVCDTFADIHRRAADGAVHVITFF